MGSSFSMNTVTGEVEKKKKQVEEYYDEKVAEPVKAIINPVEPIAKAVQKPAAISKPPTMKVNWKNPFAIDAKSGTNLKRL